MHVIQCENKRFLVTFFQSIVTVAFNRASRLHSGELGHGREVSATAKHNTTLHVSNILRLPFLLPLNVSIFFQYSGYCDHTFITITHFRDPPIIMIL